MIHGRMIQTLLLHLCVPRVVMQNSQVSFPGATGIRDHMVQSVELKFNCFLLMPVVDAFPSRLRAELEVRTLC